MVERKSERKESGREGEGKKRQREEGREGRKEGVKGDGRKGNKNGKEINLCQYSHSYTPTRKEMQYNNREDNFQEKNKLAKLNTISTLTQSCKPN